MLLKISHITRYRYDAPLRYALQRLRLEPQSDQLQTVRFWELSTEGAEVQNGYADHHGNLVRLVVATGEPHTLEITASGEVETVDNSGIAGPHRGPAPLWLYRRDTERTKPGKGIRSLATSIEDTSEVAQFHKLMEVIAKTVNYEIGATDAGTAAEEAFQQQSGVCQDHAHIMISAARAAGVPARYVSGYLMMNDRIEQVASHAWAEVHLDALGWVGFDPSNGISPDERYVRIAFGCDYTDAQPVSGIRHGPAKEALDVHIRVEQ